MSYSLTLNEAMALLGALCGVASTIIVSLAKLAITQRENAISDQIGKVESAVAKLETSILKIEKESDDGFKSMSLRITDAVHKSSQRTEELAVESMKELSHAYESQKALTERLHQEEMSTVRIDGDLRVAKQAQESTVRELALLRDSIITRAEWEARMSSLEKTLENVLSMVQNSNRYSMRTPNRNSSSPP